jgi:cbb3-type cytochrome oxidase cytochrome c subunit
MTARQRKLQKTIRFEREVVRAAAERSRRIGLPYSVVLANAAKQALLAPADASSDIELKQVRADVLSRLNALEKTMGRNLVMVREMLALLARTYLNHTAEVTESQRDAASLSGRRRFARLVDHLQRNVEDGISILDDLDAHDVQ